MRRCYFNSWNCHGLRFLSIHVLLFYVECAYVCVMILKCFKKKSTLTLTTLVSVYWAELCLLSHISAMLKAISQINEPILGMFVLIWMHFSMWFQIWSWNSTIQTFFLQILLPFWPVVCTHLLALIYTLHNIIIRKL